MGYTNALQTIAVYQAIWGAVFLFWRKEGATMADREAVGIAVMGAVIILFAQFIATRKPAQVTSLTVLMVLQVVCSLGAFSNLFLVGGSQYVRMWFKICLVLYGFSGIGIILVFHYLSRTGALPSGGGFSGRDNFGLRA
eukprot:SRR837773.6126.p3 GENE.SRR837773.6126~~SRR837773.6126.p3  ORF type:complete len:150 (+),score=17.36 SRR837773.6126:34-450(+)